MFLTIIVNTDKLRIFYEKATRYQKNPNLFLTILWFKPPEERYNSKKFIFHEQKYDPQTKHFSLSCFWIRLLPSASSPQNLLAFRTG